MEEAGPSCVSHLFADRSEAPFRSRTGPPGPQRTATLELCLRLGDRAGPGEIRQVAQVANWLTRAMETPEIKPSSSTSALSGWYLWR